jgi:hypothetical protein
MVEKCRLGKECKCVGCKVECEDQPYYCESCDGEPFTFCSKRRDK